MNIFEQTPLPTTNEAAYSDAPCSLPNILVVGYYDHGNLGDEAFKSCFAKIGPMTFLDSEKFTRIPEDTDCIIFGGGDLFNPYFMESAKELLSTFTGPVYAMSVGIPYLSGLKYLDLFDHVILRTKQDLPLVQTTLHPNNVTYMPDFTVLLQTTAIRRPFTGVPRVGFFLAQPAFSRNPNEDSLLTKMAKIIDEVSNFAEVYLLAFNTGENPFENDYVLNDKLVDLIGSKSNIINVKDAFLKKPEAMMKFMVSLDLAFCMRFHSVMFSLVQHVSFVSMYTTRKVENLLKDTQMEDYSYALPLDSNDKPTDIDIDRAIKLIKYGLAHPNNNYKFDTEVDISFIKNLLSTKKRKTIRVVQQFNKTKDEAYTDIQKYIQSYLNLDDSTYNSFLNGNVRLKDIIGTKDPMVVARLVCYGITELTNSTYVWGLTEKMVMNDSFVLSDDISWIFDDYNNNLKYTNESGIVYPPLDVPKTVVIDLQYIRQDDSKGLHRAGWAYVMGGLYQLDKTVLNKTTDAIIVDSYVDRTFHWGTDLLQLTGHIPYRKPWIGFLHHTFNTEYSNYNCSVLFQKNVFLESLATCKMLIVFTNYVAETLQLYLNTHGFTDVLVRVLRHPTEVPDLKFTTQQFLANSHKQIVQIGGWLRNSYAIYDLPIDPLWDNKFHISKAALKGKEMDNYFEPEGLFDYLEGVLGLDPAGCSGCPDFNGGSATNISGDLGPTNISGDYWPATNISGDSWPSSMCREPCGPINRNKYILGMLKTLEQNSASVNVINTLDNQDYDKLLSENIVFLNLVDCSAVNTVIECIVRNTPLIVNRHPALEEILGTNYPGFYDSLSQAASYATDYDRITAMSNYFASMDKTPFLLNTFIEKFQSLVLEATS
jgi:hypothetical protein